MNEWFALFGIFLYQSITDCVLFHWLTFVAAITLRFILSRICLLMMPMSDFDGFMSLDFGLLLKLGLWSFKVRN